MHKKINVSIFINKITLLNHRIVSIKYSVCASLYFSRKINEVFKTNNDFILKCKKKETVLNNVVRIIVIPMIRRWNCQDFSVFSMCFVVTVLNFKECATWIFN